MGQDARVSETVSLSHTSIEFSTLFSVSLKVGLNTSCSLTPLQLSAVQVPTVRVSVVGDRWAINAAPYVCVQE